MQIHISRGIPHFIDLSKQMYKVDRLANVAAYDMPTGSKEAFWEAIGTRGHPFRRPCFLSRPHLA